MRGSPVVSKALPPHAALALDVPSARPYISMAMRCWRTVLRCLAAVIFLTAAAMPVRHAPQAAPAGSIPWLVELCSADGIVRLVPAPDGPPGEPAGLDHTAAPCLLCHALPAADVPPAPAVPSLDRLVVAADLTRSDAAPPAPPLGRACNHPPTAPPRLGV